MIVIWLDLLTGMILQVTIGNPCLTGLESSADQVLTAVIGDMAEIFGCVGGTYMETARKKWGKQHKTS